MPAAEIYRQQAALLVRVLPFVAAESCFALKGGTAINLFVRDLPRLSVDIDLAYIPVADRASSLANIDAALRRVAEAITRGIPDARVTPGVLRGEACVTKLVVRAAGVQIKIEVAPVLRGCAYEPVMMRVSPAAEDQFGFAEMQVVSFPDLYGGKLVAALDRQHPRDLFDVQDLLANEGISDELRQAFIVYLISHDRPMAEVLAPTRLDVATEFARGFSGMTERAVTVKELVQAREDLIAAIVGKMPGAHRRFLLGFKKGEPAWDLLGLADVAALPAVRWKLQNLAKLTEAKRAALLANLAKALDTDP
jgi:predicted nucleotidyltransferase component of viral defense system